ncbi:hypothetical protein KCU90_g18370, partial [Aureobasidium melanogenum]
MRADLEDSFTEMLSQERLSRAAGNEPGRMPAVVKNPLDTAVMPQVESYAFFSACLEGILSYFPGSRIHKIGPTPLLMQVPKKDVVAITDTMLEAYNRAVEPKEIQILPGGHFTMFEGDEFEMMLAKEIEFLKRTLLV